ncbi:MAG: ABC transporter substrate-binding protein [Candidatus Tectomicrobia bacterium]|nr:ABC transporter substrate-binding protein [Candidatus Tectomicrobia bacterium]
MTGVTSSRPRLRGLFAIAAVGFLALLLNACGKEEQAIPIALAGPFTGNAAAFGDKVRKGAELMVEEVNARGGINGVKVKLLIGDDAADPKEAATVAQRFAADARIPIVVGHLNSSCTLAAQPIYSRAGVVELSYGSTNPRIAENSPWTFRNIYRDDVQGPTVARYAQTILKLRKVAVFYDNDDYGIGLKTGFVDEAKRIGLTIIAEEAYTRESTDFTPQLTKIRAAGPDAIFISGLYNEAALIASQARKLAIRTQLLSADGALSDDLIKIGGQAVEGLILSVPYVFSEEDPFAKRFKEKYGEFPDSWAGQAYDAVGIAIAAITAVGPNRAKIRDWLASRTTKEKGYQGVTGLTVFDEHGDVKKPVFFATVKNGKFVPAAQQLPNG